MGVSSRQNALRGVPESSRTKHARMFDEKLGDPHYKVVHAATECCTALIARFPQAWLSADNRARFTRARLTRARFTRARPIAGSCF